MKDNTETAVIEQGIDNIEGLKGQEVEASELHHHLYNLDYFIIGTYKAEQFLQGLGVFGVINDIKEYEQNNFGEVNTDFSDAEKVANMYAYIKGEEVLNNCKTLTSKWDEKLTDKDLDKIKSELEAQL